MRLLHLQMGPQHPATHGVLKVELWLDGEIIEKLRLHIGFMHRCFEKHAENLTYEQIIPFVDRLDYLSAMNCEHIYVMGVEKMLGIEEKIPKRIHYIRVLVAELNRIASHLLAIGAFGIDLGLVTAFLWCFRDREHILNLLEWLSGARMLYSYMGIGGVFFELPLGFEERTKEFLDYFQPKLQELEVLMNENPIWLSRTKGIGILPLPLAIDYGCSGPVLRGSGLRWDVRKVDQYSVYPELDFDIPIGEQGDSWDRFYVRFREIKESVKICYQCLERLQKHYKRSSDFDPRKWMPKRIRPKQQQYYVRGESPRGELGFFFITTGKSDIPFRCKVRSPSFSNLSVLEAIAPGHYFADFVAILGSIDIVLCEVDR